MSEEKEVSGVVVVHAHPVVEMRLEKDLITIYNVDTKEIESDFYIDDVRAIEIIDLMKKYLKPTPLSNIDSYVGWLQQRVSLQPYEADYLKFIMAEYAKHYHEEQLKQ